MEKSAKQDKSKKKAGLGLMCAAAVMLLSASALPAVASEAGIEEILVTATKRSESMQSVPISVSALTGLDLEERGYTEFFDYAISIPNLSFGAATDGVLSGRAISLRGIVGENTTGFYIDDTPITETIDPRILDLERIEVLRGPTGTLYGARSLGGTIRQITRKPSTEGIEGRVRASVSSTDESGSPNYLVFGTTNLPLGDRAAVILSGLYEKQSGVFDRSVGTIPDHLGAPATLASEPDFVRKNVDDEEVVALQASLAVQVTEQFSIAPRVMYQKTELDGFPLADIDADNFLQNRDFDTPEGGEDEWTLATLNMTLDTDFGTFTSATSYFDRETFEFEGSGSFINFLQALPGAAGGFGLFDVIGVQPVPSPIFQTLQFETFVQELRFTSELNGPVNFVAGLFYQDTDDVENFQPRNFASGLNDNFAELQTTLNIPGPLEDIWPFGDLVFTSARPSKVEEFGLFGEATVRLSERWSALVGLRWFDTEVTFSEQQAGLAAGVPLANDASIDTIPATLGEQSEDGVIFKAGVEFQATDDLFVYASFAEGFRLGGANGLIPNTLGCPDDLADLGLGSVDTGSFGSDDLTSYELGVKADLSRRARLNATLFFIDFDNIQQPVQLECGFQFVGNFGAAESKGVELEFVAQPTDQLSLVLNVGYTDAEFTETVLEGRLNSKGDPLQFVPEWTASLAVAYTWPQAFNGYDFFVNGDLNYVDDSLSLVNSIPRPRSSYEQLGLRVGLRNERYGLTLFARNLTNEIANLADNRSLAAETPGRPRFVVSRPRTIGLELSAEF
ncbi:MAG: TonB-dependent receptor [Pseudomonadota bacterium]